MNSLSTQPINEQMQHLQFCQQGPTDLQLMMMQQQFQFQMFPYEMAPMFDFQILPQTKQNHYIQFSIINSYLLPKTNDFQKMPEESLPIQSQLLPKLQKDLEKQPQAPKPAPILKKPKESHINTGHWTQEEHNTYIAFINQYEAEMRSNIKKTSKIFKTMSELIGTRTPSQCRSHHQKFNPFQKKVKGQRSRAGRKKKVKIEDRQQEQAFLQNVYLPQFIPLQPEINHHVEYFFQDYKIEDIPIKQDPELV